MKPVLRRALWQIVPPVALFALVVAGWQAATMLLELKPYLLPGPLLVWDALRTNAGEFFGALLVTSQGALLGFALSLAAGTAIGFVFSQSRVIRNSCFPYAIFLQTVPIVAIAPLIILWAGYGLKAVTLIAFIVSLFPMITSATAGMTSLDPNLVELFRLHGATRRQVLWKLQLPSAVPHLITGAKTSSGLAVIGAIVGEFFAGSIGRNVGLGFIFHQAKESLRTDHMIAAVLLATGLGVVVFAAVNVVGAWILHRWYHLPTE